MLDPAPSSQFRILCRFPYLFSITLFSSLSFLNRPSYIFATPSASFCMTPFSHERNPSLIAGLSKESLCLSVQSHSRPSKRKSSNPNPPAPELTCSPAPCRRTRKMPILSSLDAPKSLPEGTWTTGVREKPDWRRRSQKGDSFEISRDCAGERASQSEKVELNGCV